MKNYLTKFLLCTLLVIGKPTFCSDELEIDCLSSDIVKNIKSQNYNLSDKEINKYFESIQKKFDIEDLLEVNQKITNILVDYFEISIKNISKRNYHNDEQINLFLKNILTFSKDHNISPSIIDASLSILLKKY